MENGKTLGKCILVGLVAVAVSLPFAVAKFTDASRCVTVKGLCEREVMADRAIWPIVYKESGNSLVDMSATVEAKNAAVVKWLLDAGFTQQEISLSSPRIEDVRANGYDNRKCDYIMTSVITVCTPQVEKVVEMQARQFDLLNKGIAIGSGNTWEFPVVYDYTALNEIKPEMIEQATVSAREAADKFAKDSGSRVGKIQSAAQGQFSISDRDSNTPYIKTIRVVTTVNYRLK